MNLKELKKMIAEEYRYWMAEQPVPGAPGAPGIEVGPDDVDAMGGDSEATLRQIYDMLKAYFEGGADAPVGAPVGAPGAPMPPAGDMDDDMMDDMDMDDEGEDEEDDVSEEKEDDKDDKDDKKKDKKELKERFQKLANIVKG